MRSPRRTSDAVRRPSFVRAGLVEERSGRTSTRSVHAHVTARSSMMSYRRRRPGRPVSRLRAAARRALGAGAGTGRGPALAFEAAAVRHARPVGADHRSLRPPRAAGRDPAAQRARRSRGSSRRLPRIGCSSRAARPAISPASRSTTTMIDLRWPYRLPSPAGTSMAVEMEHLESVLAARASAWASRSGAASASRASTSDDDVTVRAGGETFRGALAGRLRRRPQHGAQGRRLRVRRHRSRVHRLFGRGRDRRSGCARPGRHYTPTGMYTYRAARHDRDGRLRRRRLPPNRSRSRASTCRRCLRRVSGTDVTLTALQLATTWTDRAYQATAYRKGRVLLAGDAAHIHSPLGGQGLNLGLGDAMNLGWKLAATIRGDAPAGLLDSYARERHPVGAQVLDWSRAQVALMRPSRSSRALEAIIRDLIETRDGATYFAERVWGVSLRYDLGGSHPLVGRSVPDFELARRNEARRASARRERPACWTSTRARRCRRSPVAGRGGSPMSRATPRIGWASAPCWCAPTASSPGRVRRAVTMKARLRPRRAGSASLRLPRREPDRHAGIEPCGIAPADRGGGGSC